ncbi:MAG TPA: DUF4349 domain-containing protein [Gemmatimonadales bacterium]|jgi:hypothetical protein|nr:DUF4349 domain-containing protein [Gemmatimonadales bacterium]
MAASPPRMLGLHAERARVAAFASVPAMDVPDLPMPTETNMVIRTATASVKVDSLEPAVTAVREMAARVGGFIANTGIQTGEGQLRSATITVKVPATRFDEALGGLKSIGKLESANVETEDVGEEYVDVAARMDNAHRLERRLIDLLATRTGKLKDVLDVEQSLAQVREEIERYEGRLRYLKAHTAMSTLTVYVHEPVPVVGSAGTSVMGEAFRQAWRNFVTFLSVFVQALGIIIPLSGIAAAAWFAMHRWRAGRASGTVAA